MRLRAAAPGEAWNEFVELYSPLLFHWAQRANMQEADAADLVQEVFAILVRKLPEFDYDPAKGFRGWLRTITLNKWREILRRRAARPDGANPFALEEVEAPPGDEPFWEIEHRQLLTRRLLEMMQKPEIPARHLEGVLGVRRRGPLRRPEIGAELNLSAGAVRAAKFRVLCRLRTQLDGLHD